MSERIDVFISSTSRDLPDHRNQAMNACLRKDMSPIAMEYLPASDAATQAYHLVWCDGPPYAYHWGLETAKKHLDELGTPYPDMPPFDPSKYEPMPEGEIDAPDEFSG